MGRLSSVHPPSVTLHTASSQAAPDFRDSFYSKQINIKQHDQSLAVLFFSGKYFIFSDLRAGWQMMANLRNPCVEYSAQ